MLTTTFDVLKSNNACAYGFRYRKLAKSLGGVDVYGRNTPIPLWHILESNGLADLFWCANKTQQPEEAKRIFRLIDGDFAERVLRFYEEQYPNDYGPRNAIRAARDFANGKIGRDELKTAERDAKRAAARFSRAAWRIWNAWNAGDEGVMRNAWNLAARAAGDAVWAAEQEKQFVIVMKWLKGEDQKINEMA